MDPQVLYAQWLDWLTRARGAADGTVLMYRTTVGWWVAYLGGRDVGSADADEIEAWLQRPRARTGGRVAAAATQHRDASALRSFYGWCVARGYATENPTAIVHTPTVRNRQPRPIPDDVWIQLWSHVEDGSALALGLGFFCGLRRAELVSLRVSHVDVANRRLVNFVRKGGGEDTLPIGTMLDVFERRLDHLQPERLWPRIERVALERQGSRRLVEMSDLNPTAPMRPVPVRYLTDWMNRLTRSTGVDRHLTPHMLRHSCATNLLRAGVPLPIVSNLLNHANVSTTMRYLKAGSDALQEWLER